MIDERYKKILENNNINLSKPQEVILAALEELNNSIVANSKGLLPSIISRKTNIAKSIYIYGGFGTGKSMLMELFYDNLIIKEKQRIHFHSLMLEVHDYMHKIKKLDNHALDPLKNVAKYLAKQYKVLCIDELQIDDIADAMVVGKLFRELLELKMVIVITSNFSPNMLYQDGLQRFSFIPFIDLIEKEMNVIEMKDYNDYRQNKLRAVETVYYVYKEGIDSDRFALDSFNRLTNNAKAANMLLNIDDRELICPITAQDCTIFSFDQLCRAPLAAIDYIALCQEFNVIILTGIPELSKDEHNEAKRFITLVDTIYDLKKILICSAKVDIESIYKQGKWDYEFSRTISRLHEMQSQEYLGTL